MKMLWPALVMVLTATAGSASDAIKIASPDKTSSVIVDKSGRRDLIFVQNGQAEHRLFYNELDTVFKPKLAAALKVPISNVGKIVLATFKTANWLSPAEVEIKGESSVTVNEAPDKYSEGVFNFKAIVSKKGDIKHLIITVTTVYPG
jgi:hypothetical protein